MSENAWLYGGVKGGNYVDITFAKENLDGTTTYTIVNTVDTYANGQPTQRELEAARMINEKLDLRGESHIILIPKNADLSEIIDYLQSGGIK